MAELARNEATRTALRDEAARRESVVQSISAFLGAVSLSAAQLGPLLAESGASCVEDLPHIMKEAPEVLDGLSPRERSEVLMAVGKYLT
jgi:hypothetical protein